MSKSQGSNAEKSHRQRRARQSRGSSANPQAAQQCSLQNVGACLDEQINFSDAPNGLIGMTADLSNLFSSFEILAGDPANLPLRRSVVRSAQAIAAQFNRAFSRLHSVEFDLNTSIQKDVVRANHHLEDVASYNEQIMVTQAAGGPTSAWVGQRGKCLEALSDCVNFVATPHSDGSVSVCVCGVAMVSGAETPDCLATFPDKNRNLHIQAQNTGARLKLESGSIAGKIAVRDGKLADLQSGLDALASQLIQHVNAIYSRGCDLNGGTGRIFFTGTAASDIGVNSAVAKDPALLQTGGATSANVSQMVAMALKRLRGWNNSVPQANFPMVSHQPDAGRTRPQLRATSRVAPHDGDTADFMHYQQACASSEKMILTLEEMSPMR